MWECGCYCLRVKQFLVFHAGCPDGFGAAWSSWRAWGSSGQYVPRGHDDRLDPRTMRGARVVFVDIAPANDELIELCAEVDELVVLDHHISAIDRITGDAEAMAVAKQGGHTLHFDLEHSGAILSWQYFHPDVPPPPLLQYVQDQDLWNWKLPRSEQVNAAIGCYRLEFDEWERLAMRSVDELAAEGEPIWSANQIEIERALESSHTVALSDGRIEAVNAQRSRSTIGHRLATRARFDVSWGIVYRVTGRRVDVSIYSIGDVNVAAVAEQHGGGGHKNAAGFSLSLEEWLTLVD